MSIWQLLWLRTINCPEIVQKNLVWQLQTLLQSEDDVAIALGKMTRNLISGSQHALIQSVKTTHSHFKLISLSCIND